MQPLSTSQLGLVLSMPKAIPCVDLNVSLIEVTGVETEMWDSQVPILATPFERYGQS